MKLRIGFVLLVLISGCSKAPVIYNDVFTGTKITIFYHNKSYDITFNNDGTISGDYIVFTIIKKSSWLPYNKKDDEVNVNNEANIFKKWKLHERGRSLYLYNKDTGNGAYFSRYLFFYKNKLLFVGGYGSNGAVVDFKSSFSDNLPELDINEVFSEDQLAEFRLLASRRYIKAEEGLYLRESNSENSPAVCLMNQGSIFDVLQADNEEKTINNIKGRWVYGYWMGIKGWAFDAYLTDRKFEKVKPVNESNNFVHRCGRFVNFRTIVYEQPDKNSPIVESTLSASSLTYYTHEKMEPGWAYISAYDVRPGFVKLDNIEECDKIDFQRVDTFKKFIYQGESGDCLTNYHFKADGSCSLEYLGTPYNSYSQSTGYHVYKYKEIYCLKYEKDNSTYTCFRFKNGIPCELELDDNFHSSAKCQDF